MNATYAHTLPDRPASEWQSLEEHLTQVGDLAGSFARPFGAEQWARLAGRWHDLGKYAKAFQDYLVLSAEGDTHQAETRGRIDHSTAGARHAVETGGTLGHLLAYVIAGHHSGLLDGRNEGACLDARLRKVLEPWDDAPSSITSGDLSEPPAALLVALEKRDAFGAAFFTRMLFSCLVDADFLDTERFMVPERAEARSSWPEDLLRRMETALEEHLRGFPATDSPVNALRAGVRTASLEAASREPGLFSLTVPTGGGKTLSSLAFALRHAIAHGLDRIIYVVPFTTIIEQNAAVFRGALASVDLPGLPLVLEHHSNLDVGRETYTSRLATENWDAPLIVTTAVQFYESLFANRVSSCRKLHNVAKSVIILDEVQAIPVDFLKPCLRALRELAEHYGSSIVLCTATQPAVERRDDFDIGLDGVREIIPEPSELYSALQRVEVEYLGSVGDDSIADRLVQDDAALCIVNTRGHAKKLFDLIGAEQEGHFHLSALMCPEHRSQVLAEILERLRLGATCRVISTQLIEAGVDIDFPVVYRSLSGVDSIAQAAGRCNRNGHLPSKGRTIVFRSEHVESEQFVRDTADCAHQVLLLSEHDRDPLSPAAVEHYFSLYYWDQSARWDSRSVLAEFRLTQDRELPFDFGFSTVSRSFQLIEDLGKPLIVPWQKRGESLVRRLREEGDFPSRSLRRALQRFTVSVPRSVWERHVGSAIEMLAERYPVLSDLSLYSENTGLDLAADQTPVLQV